jgi:hypothetical protein
MDVIWKHILEANSMAINGMMMNVIGLMELAVLACKVQAKSEKKARSGSNRCPCDLEADFGSEFDDFQ